MHTAATAVIALVMAIHVYILLLETVLFRTRGRRVFGLTAERAEIMAPAMSNQGCYNGFLAVALAIALFHPAAQVAHAFAGVWGAVTVATRILYVQTVPAVIGLVLVLMA